MLDLGERVSVAASPNEIQDALQYVGLIVTNSLPRLAVETVFLALYSIIVGCILLSRRKQNVGTLSSRFVLASCVVMYVTALVHYILTFHWVLVDNRRSNALRDTIVGCVQAFDTSNFPTSSCTLDIDEVRASLAADNDTVLAALLLISTVFSSAVLLWRTCILWPGSLALKIISGILVFCIALVFALSAGLGPANAVYPEVPVSSTTLWSSVGTEFGDVFGTTGITFVFLTTIFVVVLVSIKLWQKRWFAGDGMPRKTVCKGIKEIAFFLIDSGLLYCFIWALLVASLVEWDWPYNRLGQHYLDFIVTLKASALIDIVGLYPTFLVLLGAFAGFATEKQDVHSEV